ncbi:MAG: YjbH domain-containing protein [Desulfobacteraceae bacterium]|nr:YjbH domain-containing protein [Desulfobacteraceae bacterium]
MGKLIKKALCFRTQLLFCMILWIGLTGFADDKPFNNPANWGGTGLMEIPNARVLEDGFLRTGYAESRPFKWFTSGMGVFPGLEVGFRLTEITGTETSLGEQYGNNKDKAFDVKYQVFPESKFVPAIAFGLHDFHGTRLFPAKYAVFSRQIYPFDLTMGYGTDRLKGLFGGIEWAVNDHLQVMMEYNPIDYQKEKPVGINRELAVPEGADTPINVGLRIKPIPGVNLGITYQRGNALGFTAQLELDVGKEMMPKKPDPMFWGNYENREHMEDKRSRTHPGGWMQDIKTEIEKMGMQDVAILLEDKVLTVKCQNARYFSNQKAAGRMYRIMLFSSPEWVESLVVVFKKRNVPILSASVTRTQFKKFAFGEMDDETLGKLIKVSLFASKKDRFSNPSKSGGKVNPGSSSQPKGASPPFMKLKLDSTGNQTGPVMGAEATVISGSAESSHEPATDILLDPSKKLNLDWGIKPNLDLYLNDPSGFFKGRVGAAPYFRADIWKGGALFGRLLLPVYSNIESSNEPIPDAVRSDSWKYSDADFSLDNLFFDQVIRVSNHVFVKAGVGYFEQMYAGLSGEILGFIGRGDLALGLQGDYAIKRTPGKPLELMDFRRNTLLGNIYYDIKSLELTIQAQYGKYLAEDIGWRFTVTRSYDNGVDIGFWYSFTNTDDMTDFNRGYHDKGVFLSIPARVFSRSETNSKYSYSISPWTRDVAAVVDHGENLYGMTRDLMPGEFKSGIKDISQ